MANQFDDNAQEVIHLYKADHNLQLRIIWCDELCGKHMATNDSMMGIHNLDQDVMQ
jgi:hypothetical protein